MEISSDNSESTASNGSTIACVVKFAYVDFHIADGKWSAACHKCKKRLTNKYSVTTAFTKLYSTRMWANAQPDGL